MNIRMMLVLILSTGGLSQAQTLPFVETGGSGSTAVDFELRLDGSLLEKGTGGTLTLSNSDVQAASVFLWYPADKAFRAGGSSTETVSSIGQYSAAFGQGSSAGGGCSFAAGLESSANGYASVAMGANSSAGNGDSSIGTLDSATGSWAGAFGGYGNSATGAFSTALGATTLASNTGATSTGYSTIASGYCSASFNSATIAQAEDVSAFGQYNLGGGSANSWVTTDPLFEIGNGASASAPSDALVVYKNGNAALQGTLKMAPGGDIPMYAGD